ncbi:MAG: hypothetical protein JXQ83_00565 [Candidatus Glassbacteria bacterium]|nr:hypothetical protein [Candidatus Glassbacteria bacterium]
MKKRYIRDQIKLGFVEKLTAEAERLDWGRRLVEEIRRRNYEGLSKVSLEYGIGLAALYQVLETKAQEFLKGDQMPKSCEIGVLELMLSARADELHLVSLSGYSGLGESELLELYFLICGLQPGESGIKRLDELIDAHELGRLRDYIWDQGLHKFFNARYRSLKGIPENELSVKQIAEALSLTAVLDEAMAVKRYVEKEMGGRTKAGDMKEELYHEQTFKNSAFEKLRNIYGMFDNYPCSFSQLREAMLDLHMDQEVERIEADGLSVLKDYIRSKAVIGAREIAAKYEFIFPAVSGDDQDSARRAISGSFFDQALKSKKGRVFLRREALYNLRSAIRGAECWRFPSGHLLCVISTEDQGKHFLFSYCPSRQEQDAFILKCLACFYRHESYQAAVISLVRDYIAAMSGNIRLANAIKKIMIALPLALGLGLMIGLLYSVVIGGAFESMVIGSGIVLIGVVIAGKNGYDEEITPASHERIPDYVNRQQGRVVMGSLQLDTTPEKKKKK